MVNYLCLYGSDGKKKSFSDKTDVIIPKEFSCSVGRMASSNSFSLKLGIDDGLIDVGSWIYVPGTEFGGRIMTRDIDLTARTVNYTGWTIYGVLGHFRGASGSGNTTTLKINYIRQTQAEGQQFDGYTTLQIWFGKLLKNASGNGYAFTESSVEQLDESDRSNFDKRDTSHSGQEYMDLVLENNQSLMRNFEQVYSKMKLRVVASLTRFYQPIIKFELADNYTFDVSEIKNSSITFSEDMRPSAYTYYNSGTKMWTINTNGTYVNGGLYTVATQTAQKYQNLNAYHEIGGTSTDAEAKRSFQEARATGGIGCSVKVRSSEDELNLKPWDTVVFKSRELGIVSSKQTLKEKTLTIQNGSTVIDYSFDGGD